MGREANNKKSIPAFAGMDRDHGEDAERALIGARSKALVR